MMIQIWVKYNVSKSGNDVLVDRIQVYMYVSMCVCTCVLNIELCTNSALSLNVLSLSFLNEDNNTCITRLQSYISFLLLGNILLQTYCLKAIQVCYVSFCGSEVWTWYCGFSAHFSQSWNQGVRQAWDFHLNLWFLSLLRLLTQSVS